MNTPKPYNEKRNGNIIYRNFSQDIDESELIWHRDKEDRYVKVLNESDWGFQMDNELPIRLKKGTELFIPKETYHRVLKGRSDLNILIKENVELQDEEVTAYHGTPHSFDKFSTQYMKTGEGNQSFGWGLYFTDLEDVAKYYAETIADDSTKIWEKIKEIFYTGLGTSFIKNFNYFIIKDIQSRKINIKQAINRLKNANTKLRNISDERMAELFNKALNLETQKKYIYKVTLHKGKTPEQYTWLEWNKPLIQRQKDLILNNLPNNPAKKNKVENLKNNINKNGLEIYQMLSDIFNSDKEASLFLLRIGIDGIKYPTGTLSSALNNTSGFNYVVFDENAVTIEKQTQLQENYTPTDVDVLFKQNPDLEKSVYAILGYNKEIDDKNYEVRKAKYAAQNKIMSDKQVSFANGRGLDRTVRELRKINTPESNIVADLIEVERVNIRAKQFNTKTDEGKLKSKEQYDIKNRLLDNVFKQYRKNGWDVKYERSSMPGVEHTLFFTIPDTDIQLSYHGNYENISKYFNSLPEGRWDGIPGATFHKLEEAALDIINENNMDKTNWRKGIDLGQEFIQLPYTYTEQQKQEARKIYSEYLQNNPEGDLEGFKEYINSKNLQLETMEVSKKDLIQNWMNNPKKLREDVQEITKGELEEAKKKKDDRCTRIAKSKYDVWPSAYASGAVVKCRQGKIWKGLKEEDESLDNYPKELIKKAHDAITRRKGKDYAPDVHELQAWIDKNQESLDEKWSEKYKRSIDCNNPKGFSQKAHCKGRLKEEEESLDEKTDFSKEKSKGLHGWFERQGGKGKSKGWVDCNTCRTVDGKKKCKTCGRQEGEKRAKYPACRPTPSACGSKGRGKSWGKKSKTNENMEIKKRDMFDEDLVLKRSPSDKKIYVQSDLSDESARKKETFKNKEALKKAGFTWDGKNGAWNINDANFPIAKKTIEAINKKESLINQLEELEEIIFSAENFDGKNNLMDRIDLYINDLANATDEVAVSAEIRKYLTFFSKFRTYSLHNSMLIYIQSGGKATRVRTKPQWYNDFHRKIKKGAKAIWIFRPENLKGKTEIDAETGEEVTKQNITRFVPYPTFDIADTEPIDERGEIPEEPKWYADLEPTERSIELYKYFIELCENMGIEITKSNSERGEKGYSAGNKINISSAKEGAGEISTLVHEIAHELMHWKKSSLYYQENTDGQLRELQAESVSYVVLKHYELPTEHHPTYLALWKASKDKIKANLKVISDVASFIISEIDSIERKHKKDKNVISESRNVLLKKELEREIKLDEIKDVFKRYMGKI